jgi:hypothetical protein
MITGGLTAEERAFLDALSGLWEAFRRLPVQHSADALEASQAIHRLQDLVAARPVYRAIQMQAALERRAGETN